MARQWLALAAALLALVVAPHTAVAARDANSETASVVSDCGNSGKTVLAKGAKATQAIVYGASCNVTTLTVDAKGKLTASGLKLQAIQSLPPDVVELNLALNALSAIPKLENTDKLTKLTLTSNQFTSFKDINVPSKLKALDLSWNAITSFEHMELPSTLTELYVGGNKIASLRASFPPTLKLLYVHDLPLTASLADATLPDAIAFLSLVNSQLTTLPRDKLPANITSLDVSKNRLTTLPTTFPTSLVTLIASENNLTSLTNISFPVSMTILNFSSNPITTIRGVAFPWSLATLDLGNATITTLELSRTDYTTLSRLKAFSARIQVAPNSCKNGAEQVALGVNAVCVLTDAAFQALYRTDTTGNASANDPSASTNNVAPSAKRSSVSTVLIVVICVAAVLAVALAVVGVRSYRRKLFFKQQPMDGAAAFPHNDHIDDAAAVDRLNIPSSSSSGNVYTTERSARANGSDLLHSNYNLNTIFQSGNATRKGGMMMNSSSLESSLIKYRIPSTDLEIAHVLAKGGFGVVHLAHYHNDKVAVKKILPDKASDDRCLAAFLDEIKLCSTLRHAKIVGFIGVSWNTLSDMAVVLELMPNGDLEQLLRRQHRQDKDDTFDWYASSSTLPSKAAIALDVLEAVVYLHSFSAPIIHRDLKAKNVLLSATYEAKLSDFGISREWAVDATMTAGIGTMAWIAPEVLRGERYTEMADMYSLGVLLTELATCRKPFEGIPNAMIVLKVTSHETPALGDDCPIDVRELAQRCLSFNASERPSAMVAHYEMRTLLKLHTKFEL